MTCVAKCDDLLNTIEQIRPDLKKELVGYNNSFGFALEHVLYVEESGRRTGGGYGGFWHVDHLQEVYLQFINYTYLGEDDKRPQGKVCVVFWQKQIFHFHFHEVFYSSNVGFNRDDGESVYWAVFFIDYITGWDSVCCTALCAQKIIEKIVRLRGAVKFSEAGLPKISYLPHRLESYADFVIAD